MYNRILIVDDSVIARMMIRRCLEIAGYGHAVFFEAANGVEAIDRLKNTAVDLILTDLNMPEMGGKLLIKRLKSSPRLTSIPVIVVSSITNDSEEADLLARGVSAVIRKPIFPMMVMEAIESIKL
jgi:two-component system, chemotaxis family, chemotaxis protein CheY